MIVHTFNAMACRVQDQESVLYEAGGGQEVVDQGDSRPGLRLLSTFMLAAWFGMDYSDG